VTFFAWLFDKPFQVPVQQQPKAGINPFLFVKEVAVLKTVFKQITRGFHIVTAVFGQFPHFPLAEPLYRLKAMGGLSSA